MYEYCKIIKSDCPHCALFEGRKWCGMKKENEIASENEIENMTVCPLKEKRKKR